MAIIIMDHWLDGSQLCSLIYIVINFYWTINLCATDKSCCIIRATCRHLHQKGCGSYLIKLFVPSRACSIFTLSLECKWASMGQMDPIPIVYVYCRASKKEQKPHLISWTLFWLLKTCSNEESNSHRKN